jgi:hypothetical protein
MEEISERASERIQLKRYLTAFNAIKNLSGTISMHPRRVIFKFVVLNGLRCFCLIFNVIN